jgi:hypothetical protein
LLRAAQIIIATEIERPERPELETYEQPGTGFAQAFIENWEDHPLRLRNPNSHLFRAGEMVHTAAMLEVDDELKEQLTSVATKLYDQHSRGKIVGTNDVRGYNITGDIEYAHLMERIRLDAKDDKEGAGKESPAWEVIEELLVQDAVKLKEFFEKFSPRKNFRHNYLGNLFADFNVLALRRKIWRERLSDFVVRHSFEREDHTIYSVRPKASYDMVIEHHTDAGVTATPVEVKLAGKDTDHENSRKETYLPGLEVGRFSDLNPKSLGRALKQYADGDNPYAPYARENRIPFARIEDRYKKIVS